MIGLSASRRAQALLATVAAAAFVAMLLAAASAAWQKATGEAAEWPRFASLRSARANLRVGPGRQYPVEWIYRRAGWPVEIIAAYGDWRRVRDADGTEGWVHRLLLSPGRTIVVRGGVRLLREAPDDRAAVVARVESGVVAELDACRATWCRVEAAGHEGWIRRAAVWGVDHEGGRRTHG